MVNLEDVQDYLDEVLGNEEEEDDAAFDDDDDVDERPMSWLNRDETGFIDSRATEVVANWCEEVIPAWQQSPEYAALPQYTWKVRDEIPATAIDLSYAHHTQLPQQWTWHAMEDTLLHLFPEEIAAPKYYFKALGRVMQNFCQFLARDLRLTHLEGFPAEIKKIQKQLDVHARDPQVNDPTKFLSRGKNSPNSDGYHFDF
jgi:hypothetical protein